MLAVDVRQYWLSELGVPFLRCLQKVGNFSVVVLDRKTPPNPTKNILRARRNAYETWDLTLMYRDTTCCFTVAFGGGWKID